MDSDTAPLKGAERIAAYLKTLPAIANPIPGPAAPRQEPPGTVQAIVKRAP